MKAKTIQTRPSGEPRSRRFVVLMTEREFDGVQEAAAKDGLSAAEWVRRQVSAGLGGRQGDADRVRAMASELVRISNALLSEVGA